MKVICLLTLNGNAFVSEYIRLHMVFSGFATGGCAIRGCAVSTFDIWIVGVRVRYSPKVESLAL
jgi:hypothetical protein